MDDKQLTDKQREREAKRILDRIENESETVGRSSMRRVAEHTRSHLRAEDADQTQWAEVWGTRIGRGLGLVFVVVLIIYLARTYILNG